MQITYDVLPLVAFLALVIVGVGAYMFYAGNKVRLLILGALGLACIAICFYSW